MYGVIFHPQEIPTAVWKRNFFCKNICKKVNNWFTRRECSQWWHFSRSYLANVENISNVRICPPSCQLTFSQKTTPFSIADCSSIFDTRIDMHRPTYPFLWRERERESALSKCSEFARHPLIMSVSVSIPASSANLTQGGGKPSSCTALSTYIMRGYPGIPNEIFIL